MQSRIYYPENVLRIESLENKGIKPFKELTKILTEHQDSDVFNSIDLIVIDVLNKKGEVYNFKRKHSYNVYIFSNFDDYPKVIDDFAPLFAIFYKIYHVLPNLIPISFQDQRKAPSYIKNNGVIAYERV